MTGAAELLEFASGVLKVPATELSLESTMESVSGWDSMAQLRLVMEFATRFGVEIPFAEVTEVTSLWEFYRRLNRLPPKKVVAVDLDNTLWKGVIGEDGRDGVIPDTAFQKRLLALKNRGALLVALSKNNVADIVPMFDGSDPRMTLSEADFVAMKTDWNPKCENLAAVAEELNLGLDAFVFVDDNPVERAEMAARLPEVTVAEFPAVIEAYFPDRPLTDEDRVKTEEYRAEAGRKRFAEGRSREEWLAGLGIHTDIHPARPEEFTRIAQLSQKANQYKTADNRYTREEIAQFASDPERILLTLHAGDRFGEQGLVAFAHSSGRRIVDFTMSCRVAGRGFEELLVGALVEAMKQRGITDIGAEWIPSGRNEPVRGLFARCGLGKDSGK